MYKQINPHDLPMSRFAVGKRIRADIEDFCEATGITTAEVIIPAGVKPRSLDAAYRNYIKKMGKQGQIAVRMHGGRTFLYDPRRINR